MNLKLLINIVLYNLAIAFVVGGVFSAILWGVDGNIPPGGNFHLGTVVATLTWLSVYSPHFQEHEKRYVAMFSPLKLIAMFVFIQLAKPIYVDGYILALALFSLLTTYNVVRGRVFN